MDIRTNEIMTYDEMAKRVANNPEDKKFYKEIPDIYLGELSTMNRKDRRAYLRKNKHILKDI